MSSGTTTTERSRWIALGVLCAGMLMIVLDQTVVNVALPAIQRDLEFTQSALAWVVNSYLIAFGGLLLLAGRLGDLIGRRRVLLTGLTVFTAASALCGLSTSQEMLIAARFIQGAGGALTAGVILGMVVTLFPAPTERAKALGVYSFVASAGASIGLLAGGILTEGISWHWIFFVNLPIGAVTFVLLRRLVPADSGLGLRAGADVPGAVFVTSGLMLGVYAIVEAANGGWGSARTVGFGSLSLILLVAFVVRQATAATPLLPLRVFRSRALAGANIVVLLTVAGMFGMFFLGSLYLQRVLGYGALGIGLAFLPVAASIGTLALGFSARLSTRFGPRAVLQTGLALAGLGLLLFTRTPVNGAYVTDVLPSMLLLGIGMGLTFPSVMALAMADVDPRDSGLASGLVNTMQQAGGALGLAVLATLATSRTNELLARGTTEAVALTQGYRLAYAIGAGLVFSALAVTALVLPRRATTITEEDARVADPALVG